MRERRRSTMAKPSWLIMTSWCFLWASIPSHFVNAFLPFSSPSRLSSIENPRNERWRKKFTWSRVQVMKGAVSLPNVRINKDVLVIGGGLAGLATALELAKRGRQVTVLSRNRAEAAADAAGGMIAPQSERLESGSYLNLCLSSRAMYADWVSSVETIAGLGARAHADETFNTETHFWSAGGFLSPAFENDAVHTWNPPPEGGRAHWLDGDQVLGMEPLLSPDIVGAWWFPLDMSIDAQRLFRVLEQACLNAGVEILEGTAAASLVYNEGGSEVDAAVLEDGRRVHAKAIVSATGAWMRQLMPVPMMPHKGQMMSLREPSVGSGSEAKKPGVSLGLSRVLFAEGCYIIPKRDGRIVVGSTVEVGDFGLHNTPAGVRQIIDAAVKVCPALADLAIERTWAGLRPVTPDCHPVLGASSRCSNLFVAGGYWRNGVLLAPKTAQLVADAVCGCLSPADDAFMKEFNMDRFTSMARQEEQSSVGTTSVPSPTQVSTQAQAQRGGDKDARSVPGYASGVTHAELLEMERAALEGTVEGSTLPAFGGMSDEEDQESRQESQQDSLPLEHWQARVELEETGTVTRTQTRTGRKVEDRQVPLTRDEGDGGPVNEYDASEMYNEDSLREARIKNRLLQDGGADARLEALYGDATSGEDGADGTQSAAVAAAAGIMAWEEGAEEAARIIGAEIVEIDVPEGMSEEEAIKAAMANEDPIIKVMWQRPDGMEVEVPRGMNLATMVKQGLIDPRDTELAHREGGGVGESGSMPGTDAGGVPSGSEQPRRGVFDPSAVRGETERTPEMSELYAKVMANKEKNRVRGRPGSASGGNALSNTTAITDATDSGAWGYEGARPTGAGDTRPDEVLNGFADVGGDQRTPPGSSSLLETIMQQVDGPSAGGREGESSDQRDLGAGEEGTGEEEMVGYDFILKDRGEDEAEKSADARASVRDAPEGEETWAAYDKIAEAAIADMENMGPIEFLPPR